MHKDHVTLVVSFLLAVLCVSDVTGRGLPASLRSKRISSDQRMAELQALMAMSYQSAGAVGHGMVDFNRAGKRSVIPARPEYDEDEMSQDERLVRIMERLTSYMGTRDTL